MKISLTAKKGILLFSLSAIIACGGGSNKETKNVENSQGGKEISASKETVDTGKEAKSYETELMERMNPIEEKVNKTIESGENMLAASFDLDEKWKISLTESNGGMLITHLSMALKRIEENENVSSIDEGVFQEVLKSEKLEEIQEIYNDIEKNVFIEKLPEEEKKYILVNLLLIKENE